MQITVKTSKCLKEGENDYGPWALFKIVATDEKVYTTLAKGAEVLTPGAIFEPVDVLLGEIKNDVQEYKFKKFTLVTASSELPAPGPNGSRETSPEEWKEKQRIERASFEGPTSFKGIVNISQAYVAAGIDPGGVDSFKEIYDLAMDYAKKRLAPTLTEALATLPHLARPETEGEGDPKTFKNVGEFLTAMLEKGLSRTQVIDELIRLELIKVEADLPKLDLNVVWEALGDAIIPKDIPL